LRFRAGGFAFFAADAPFSACSKRRCASASLYSLLGVFDMARFANARLKLEWARHHINQLHALWQGYLEMDFCELQVEDDPAGGQTLKIVSIKPFPGEIVLTLGDAVHNMRAALDYTVSELLGWKDTRLTFPMGEDREELIDSFRTEPETVNGRTKKKGRNAAIEVAVPGIGKFIVETICSYKSSKGFLWALGKLDARDKHRLLLPVVVPQSIGGINTIDKNNNRMIDCYAEVGAGGVARLVTFGDGGLKIESYGKPTAEIFLHEIGIVEHQRLFPTLVQMSQTVAQTIDLIEGFVAGAPPIDVVVQRSPS
jgi:hypothetical protein